VSATKWAASIVGLILFLAGTVFALQGDGVIGGSALMSGNPTWIYIGALIALVGIVMLVFGLRRSPTR
jgi:hypothetical protein